jgi:hypothetical protein
MNNEYFITIEGITYKITLFQYNKFHKIRDRFKSRESLEDHYKSLDYVIKVGKKLHETECYNY